MGYEKLRREMQVPQPGKLARSGLDQFRDWLIPDEFKRFSGQASVSKSIMGLKP
jgi:hypothetical protein